MDFPGPATLLLVALTILPTLASAERVVVGSIRGDRADVIRDRVETTLRERVEVVPWSEFRAAYRGLDAEAIRSACRAVNVRAIVLGDVEGPRRLNLMALSCETGEIAAESQVDLRRGVPRADSLYAAVAAMFFEQGAQSLLTWATRGPGREGGPPGARATTPSAQAVQASGAPTGGVPRRAQLDGVQAATAQRPTAPTPSAPAGTPAAELGVGGAAGEQAAVASLLDPPRGRFSADGEGPTAHATGDEAAEPAVEAELAPGPPALAFLELALGATFATRTLDVVDRAGQSVGYAGGGYTELGGQATVFPLALVSRARWARIVGLSGSFSKGVGVQSASSGLNVDALDGGFGLVGRLAFEGGLPIEIRPQVGYGFRGFAIDWNPDIATFNYRFIRVGVDVRATLLRRASYAEGTVGALTLGLAGGYRFVSDLGEAASAYGVDATGLGWDVGAFASVLLGRSLEISAGGELARFSSTFAGQGSLERLATSSEDMFPRAFLRAGLALR
jgi:hypothetical protein